MSFVFCFLYRYSAFVCPFICWVCLWMSEGSDQEYKPTQQGKKLKEYTVERPRTTRREVNYKESLILLESDDDTGGLLNNSTNVEHYLFIVFCYFLCLFLCHRALAHIHNYLYVFVRLRNLKSVIRKHKIVEVNFMRVTLVLREDRYSS